MKFHDNIAIINTVSITGNRHTTILINDNEGIHSLSFDQVATAEFVNALITVVLTGPAEGYIEDLDDIARKYFPPAPAMPLVTIRIDRDMIEVPELQTARQLLSIVHLNPDLYFLVPVLGNITGEPIKALDVHLTLKDGADFITLLREAIVQ